MPVEIESVQSAPPKGKENVQDALPKGTESIQSASFYNTESQQTLYSEEILTKKPKNK